MFLFFFHQVCLPWKEVRRMDSLDESIGESIVAQCVAMGFSENGCKRAALATNNTSAEAAMEWIFAHMQDSNFNNPIEQYGTGVGGAAQVSPESVEMLMGMGFQKKHAEKALKECGSDIERAADWLFSRMDSLDAMDVDEPAPASSSAASPPPPPPPPKQLSSTIFGSVYVQQGHGVGQGSVHFVSEIEGYINYTAAPVDWLLDDGSRLPAQKPFTETSYDPVTRTFCGKHDWSPTSLNGCQRRQFKMVFSDDFDTISGKVMQFLLDGSLGQELPLPKACRKRISLLDAAKICNADEIRAATALPLEEAAVAVATMKEQGNWLAPPLVCPCSSIVAIAAGTAHMAAVTEDGSLWTWGWCVLLNCICSAPTMHLSLPPRLASNLLTSNCVICPCESLAVLAIYK